MAQVFKQMHIDLCNIFTLSCMQTSRGFSVSNVSTNAARKKVSATGKGHGIERANNRKRTSTRTRASAISRTSHLQIRKGFVINISVNASQLVEESSRWPCTLPQPPCKFFVVLHPFGWILLVFV